MTRVIRFMAKDGEEFTSKEACLRYEEDGCVFFERLPKYGDHVPLTDSVLRCMLDGDGSCYYATADRMSRITAHSAPHPDWATHLIYFGK